LIRPVVLFGRPPAVRARETGAPQRTLARQADAFDRDGMISPGPPAKPDRYHTPPAEIRRAIRERKAAHPPRNPREIATSCDLRCGRSISHHTVKRVPAEEPVVPTAARRFPPYRRIADPAARRLALIGPHSEGWNEASIAAYPGCSRVTVHETLKRWATAGVAGPDDKPHARKDGRRKVDMAVLTRVRALAQDPEPGASRLYAALTRVGLHLSVRTCRRLPAKNRARYGPVAVRPAPWAPRPMPRAAWHRHHIWSVDIRYRKNGHRGERAYAIAIMDNYARSLAASAVAPRQDPTACRIVLHAAIRQHGAPEMLVSDSGGVCKAKQAQAIDQALGIERRAIARRPPWQHSVEAPFGVQKRMADRDFARAETWAALADEHARWTGNDNAQEHFAHRCRPKRWRSPGAPRGCVSGREVAPAELQRRCYRPRFARVVDRLGSLRFRHGRGHGERGLAGERAAIWRYEQTPTVARRDEVPARYRVTDRPDRRHCKQVSAPRLFATPHRSPQPTLWELGDGEWLAVVRLPGYTPQPPRGSGPGQARLFL